MSIKEIKNKAITDYWHEFYVSNGYCSLCGNSGVIDTTIGATTPKGEDVGRANFCICPNGQAFRKEAVKKSGNRYVKP